MSNYDNNMKYTPINYNQISTTLQYDYIELVNTLDKLKDNNIIIINNQEIIGLTLKGMLIGYNFSHKNNLNYTDIINNNTRHNDFSINKQLLKIFPNCF